MLETCSCSVYTWRTSNSSPSPDRMTRASHCDRSVSLTRSLAWFWCSMGDREKRHEREGQGGKREGIRSERWHPFTRSPQGGISGMGEKRDSISLYQSIHITLDRAVSTLSSTILPAETCVLQQTSALLKAVLCLFVIAIVCVYACVSVGVLRHCHHKGITFLLELPYVLRFEK